MDDWADKKPTWRVCYQEITSYYVVVAADTRKEAERLARENHDNLLARGRDTYSEVPDVYMPNEADKLDGDLGTEDAP